MDPADRSTGSIEVALSRGQPWPPPPPAAARVVTGVLEHLRLGLDVGCLTVPGQDREEVPFADRDRPGHGIPIGVGRAEREWPDRGSRGVVLRDEGQEAALAIVEAECLDVEVTDLRVVVLGTEWRAEFVDLEGPVVAGQGRHRDQRPDQAGDGDPSELPGHRPDVVEEHRLSFPEAPGGPVQAGPPSSVEGAIPTGRCRGDPGRIGAGRHPTTVRVTPGTGTFVSARRRS